MGQRKHILTWLLITIINVFYLAPLKVLCSDYTEFTWQFKDIESNLKKEI